MREISDMYEEYQERQEALLMRRPKCCMCNEHIQTEYYFNICGDYYCEDCIEECKQDSDYLDD